MRARAAWPVRLFFALTVVVFTCVYPYNVYLHNPNENVRLFTIMSMVEFHTFRIDKMVDRYGWVNDMAKATDKDGKDHLYSVKGPALAYAGAPVYWVFQKLAPHFGHPIPTAASSDDDKVAWLRASTIVLRIFVVQLPCLAFLFWFERWLRPSSADPVLRLSAVAAAGLGTNYLAYSLLFVSHALDGVTTFTALALLTTERKKPPDAQYALPAALAGFMAGLASLLEYQAFVLSVFLAGYAVFVYRRLRPLAFFSLGALINASLLMFYQWRCFRNPLTPGYRLAENEAFAEWHNQGFFGIVRPKWDVLRDLSTNTTFGFFGTSHFMWIGFYGALLVLLFESRHGEAGRRRMATLFWALMMGTLWLAMSAAVNWRGGWTVGPRLLGPAPPFFAFGAVCGLELMARQGRLWRALARGLASGLALASVCTLGFVAIVCTSIPEDVDLPLIGLTLPLARAGFVPHHAAEIFGFRTTTFWYFVACSLVGAPLVVTLWPCGDRGARLVARLVLAAFMFVIGMGPAVLGWDPMRAGPATVALAEFARHWEPQGRDKVARLRAQADAKGAKEPCLWHRLAELERTLSMYEEADRDTARAHIPKSACH